MKINRFYVWITAILIGLVCILPIAGAVTLDAPHSDTNGISCGRCHYTSTAFPLAVFTDEDDTANNRICWNCHNDADSSMAETHSSVTLGAKYRFGSVAWPDPTSGMGGWSVQCTDCHDPHEQAQYRFYGGAAAGLVSGVTVSANPYDSARNATTLTVNPTAGRISDWGTNRWAGYILFFTGPQSSGSMRILSSETATGGEKLLTVEGDASALANEGFAIAYGKMIKSSIGGQTVRFFGHEKSGDGTDYSFADTSGSTHSGVCETCHVRTTAFKSDGTGTHNYGVKSGDNCVFCHVAQNAFKPADALKNFSGSPLVSIALTPPAPAVFAGQTLQFSATGTFADGTAADISGSVFWSSSSTATATIDRGGLAAAVAAGSSTIMAASGNISGNTTLTVTQPVPYFVDGGVASGINYDSAKAALEPQLTVFGTALYAAWHETNGTANQIRVKKYDGTSWTWAGGANGLNYNAARAATSPQLTVFGSALYAAWYETNGTVNQIRVKKFDGTSWTWADGGGANGLNFTVAKNARNPQLTVFGSSLYATWEEMSPANFSQIRIKKYDGASWTWADGGLAVGINYSPTMSATAPQLTGFNGSLYAVWQEKNASIDQVRVKRYNGTSWTWADGGAATGINYSTANNGDRAQLTVFGSAMYATWREGNTSVKYQARVKKYDGTSWTWADGGGTSGLNYNAAQDAHEPQLTALGSDMYAIWCEQSSSPNARQVRVKKFDGTTWTWFDGGGATGINYDTTKDGNHQQLTAFNGRLYAAWWEAAATESQIRVKAFPLTTVAPDFSMSTVYPPVIFDGTSGGVSAGVTRTGGHTAAVALSIASNSQGITGSGTIASGATSGTLTITVPSSVAAGTYALTLNGSDGSLARSAGFSVTVSHAPTASTTGSAFGVYMSHTVSQNFMQAQGMSDQEMFNWSSGHMADIGAHWTRYSLLASWTIIEPTLGGGYNWNSDSPNGKPDTILGAVYASGNDIHAVVNIQSLSFGTGAPTRSPFTNPTEYATFVQALAERYDGDGTNDAPGAIKVDYFQLGNEVQDWFDRGLTADQYGEAAKMTLNALRAGNPNAQIVMLGGFAENTGNVLDSNYKQAILAMQSRGVKPAAIDIHWWYWTTAASDWQSPVILDARAYLDSIGWQDVQIWSMEDGAWTGCPTNLNTLTETDQAVTLVKRYVWGRANGLNKLFWQSLLDLYSFSGQTDSPFNSMGLIDDGEQNCSDPARRNTTRIAYWSYRKLAAATDNLVAAPAGTVAGTHDGTAVFAYQYTRNSDSSPFYIVWREDVTGNVTLSVPGTNYHVTNLVPDRFGTFQESDITASSGSITVSAGSQPLLIVPSPSPAYLLVTQLSGSGVYKVDPATNLVSSQLTFGTNVGRPAADLSRRIAWLPLGSQLLALKPDTMTYSTLTVIGLGNDGTFAAISPDGRTLAVVNHGADGLRSADDRLDIVTLNPDVWPPTASLNFTVTVGQQPIRTLIGHNGRYAVVSVRDDAKILVIDLTTQQTALQITLPAGSEPEGMDLSPTQNIAYVTLHGTNKIEIIDLGTAPPREIGSVAIQSGKGSPQPSGGHFTPDGTRFYISGQVTNEILLFNTATITAPVQDTGVSLATGTQPHDIAFLPDGRAYVANTNNGQPHGSLSIIQNYTGTPSVSGQVLTDVIINPLYMGYFPAVP